MVIMDGEAPCTVELSVRPDGTSSIDENLCVRSRTLNLDSMSRYLQ
jgi:hypothetical protein